MKLSFDSTRITQMLDSGRVRVSSPSGVNAKVSTKDGEIVADSGQRNVFVVDTECGNTVVKVETGQVDCAPINE